MKKPKIKLDLDTVIKELALFLFAASAIYVGGTVHNATFQTAETYLLTALLLYHTYRK